MIDNFTVTNSDEYTLSTPHHTTLNNGQDPLVQYTLLDPSVPPDCMDGDDYFLAPVQNSNGLEFETII